MNLKTFTQTLEEIAPPALAESWDNTGLLLEPLQPQEIQTVLLAIDLTDAVALEAVEKGADAVIAYHPIFFSGVQRLDTSTSQSRAALRLIQNNIALYSPHTALDAAPGGVNDWLATLVGPGKISRTEFGGARTVTLETPIALDALAQRIKAALQLDSIRGAQAHDRLITKIALCAGAGTEAFRGIDADVYWTGEMKHHDVLGFKEAGISTLLCGHTETERGYLAILRDRLHAATGNQLTALLSVQDTAPLKDL